MDCPKGIHPLALISQLSPPPVVNRINTIIIVFMVYCITAKKYGQE
jgi:hypothetical protein